jgi:anti-anti-sigma factor
MAEPGAALTISPTADGWKLDGELDAHTAPALTEAMAELPDGEVVVDLGGVTFVDSSGLRVLLEATNRARAAGGDLTLASLNPSIQRLIDISGLSDHMHVR